MKSLTPKQQRFVHEFMVDLNATAAAKRAGYSERTARVIGHENLTKPDIVDAITDARRRLAEKSEVSVEWVLAELMKIAEANIMNYIKIHPDGSITPRIEEIIRDYGGAVADYKVKEVVIELPHSGKCRRVRRCFSIKLGNKLGALQTLGKYLGMFETRKEVGGADISQKRYIIENENESDMDM